MKLLLKNSINVTINILEQKLNMFLFCILTPIKGKSYLTQIAYQPK